jgi:hypothetical protein
MSKRDNTFKPVEEKAVILYKKLLEIVQLESSEIEKQNLDRVEHYWAQKLNILKELDELKTDDQWMGNQATHAELGKLIKKIMNINDANADAVTKLKNGINVEISDLHKNKSAYKAYNSQK